jgi:P-type Ca2+ transporter type 2C
VRVPNPALPWVVLGACAFLALVLLVPAVQRLFHFAPLHATDVLISLGAGVACVLWFELVKLAKRRLA